MMAQGDVSMSGSPLMPAVSVIEGLVETERCKAAEAPRPHALCPYAQVAGTKKQSVLTPTA